MPKALRFLGWPVLVGVLLALLIIQHNPELVGLPRQEVHVEQAPLLSRLQEGPVSYANAVSRAAPAVANLYTTKMVSKPSHPLFDDPMFRRFFGDNLPQQKRMESSLGSAVIMSAEGYLLTNNHVTAGADQIIVALRDGRETIAQLVGSDPETDLAVLKIDLKNLPAMTLGRSDGIRTGDVCLAIGNPFGVGQTVTMGIISATGRNQLGLNTYEDFIQTDAAINPGNSGGALVDAAGNLIGINTAIFSKSGGSQGIGFAIPTKLALEVMQSIIEHGQVIRGWLGVEVKASGGTRRPAAGRCDPDHRQAGSQRRPPLDEPGGAHPSGTEDQHRGAAQRTEGQPDRRGRPASAAGTGSTAETGRRRVIPAIENGALGRRFRIT